MKRYLSVFEMIARSSIYKVILILVGMVSVEAIFFYNTMISPKGINIEEYIDQSQYSLIFKVAYILITIILVLPGMNIGSTQSYTLQRLRIKEKRIFWIQGFYNILAYVLLWGAQLVVILASIILYQNNLPKTAILTNQTMFLAFYRNDFMHSILPLEDAPGWWVLVLIGISTAFVAAEFTKLQRQGKIGVELLILLAAVLISFPRELGVEFTFFVIVLCVVGFVMGMRWILNMEVKES